MRAFSSFVAAICVALALSPSVSYAGQVGIDPAGQITWQSTQCPEPPSLNVPEMESEAPAESLNELVGHHNQHVAQIQATMDCLRRESEADASAAAQSITDAAQMRIHALAQESARSSAWLRHRQQN